MMRTLGRRHRSSFFIAHWNCLQREQYQGSLLLKFTSEERLSKSDPWYCSRCKQFQCAMKKLDLWRLPNVLIIHLKRFRYNRNNRDKISTLVDFPISGLDLSQWMAKGMYPHGRFECIFRRSQTLLLLGNV